METVERVCPVCGTTYEALVGRLKHGRQTTCSRECSYKFRFAHVVKTVELRCATCGKTFRRSPSHLKSKHGSYFCSRDCHYAGRSIGATKRVVTKPYVYTPEGKAAQIAAVSRPKGKRVFHWLTCANCGKEFDDPNDGRARKSGVTFCSLECCNTYRKGENNPAWRGGYPGYYGPDWRALRRAARVRDDSTCQRCGKEQRPPQKALDVHHIIPVSAFKNRNDANTINNVVTLCHPCHMQAEWHGLDFTPNL